MSEEINDTQETTEETKSQRQLDIERAAEIVGPLQESGADDDEMAMALVTEGGFQFSRAQKLRNLALEYLGVRMSSKERYEKVAEILIENDFAPEDWDEVEQVVAHLVGELDDTSERQALSAVRRFAKDQEITLPPKPKKGGKGRSGGFRAVLLRHMVDNPHSTKDEFAAWMASHGKNEAMTKRFWQLFETAQKMAANMS